MSDAIIKKLKVNTLDHYNGKAIIDHLVLDIFSEAREKGLSAVGTIEGWTEPPTIPPIKGHLMFVVRCKTKPFDEVNHTRWLRTNDALCKEPGNDDFVVNDYYRDRSRCLECLMRLMAKS